VLNGKLELAFDHLQIVRDAIERVRVELEVSGIATAFVGTTFTMAELRAVYEAIWGERLDPARLRFAAGTRRGVRSHQKPARPARVRVGQASCCPGRSPAVPGIIPKRGSIATDLEDMDRPFAKSSIAEPAQSDLFAARVTLKFASKP
jgi:hypothetical protein